MVPPVLERIVLNVGGKKPRREFLEGRPHLVAPARILKEGVLNGSGGPGFYPHDENKKNFTAWNHMPIVIDHPDVDGSPVSARSPDVLNSRKIGIVLNAVANDTEKAIDVECWFDEDLTKKLDKRVYKKVSNGEGLECSTGLHLNADTGSKGEFGDAKVKYDWTARDQNPDHLAALPDKVGALSLEAGGGIFHNAEKEPEACAIVQKRTAENALKAVGIEFVGNELSFNTISRFLSDSLSTTHGEKGRYWDGWVQDVFSDHVVFSDGKGKTMKQSYTANDKGITLVGKPVEVVRTVTYQPVGNAAPGDTQEQKMDRTAKINSLIGNGYAETDRAALEKLDDATLALIKPVTNAAPASPPPPPPAPAGNGSLTPLTREQAIAILPPDMVAVLNFGQQTIDRTRALMVNSLKSLGTRNPYSDEYLNKLPPEQLEALCKLAGVGPGQTGAPAAGGVPGGMFSNGYQPGWMNMGGFGPPPAGANYLLNAGNLPVVANADNGGDTEPMDEPVVNGVLNKKGA